MKIDQQVTAEHRGVRSDAGCEPLRSGTLGALFLVVCVAFELGGCAGSGSRSTSAHGFDPNNIQDAVPRHEPRSRYGNMLSYVVFGKRYHTRKSSRGFVERGIASWYGTKFHGRKTSSGERYNMYQMTAAHKSLPLPTYVRVTNLDNGKSTVVKVNDRGPFHHGRVIDLSYAAATKLDVVRHGTARVEVRAVQPGHRGSDPGPFLARGGKTRTHRVSSPAATPSLARRDQAAQTKRAVDAALAATGAQEVAAPKPPVRRAAAAGDKGLYLQVGAFGDAANAERLRQRLVSQWSGKVRVQSTPGSGSTLYKVRVGPFGSEHEASQVSARLVTLGVDRPSTVWN